MRRRAVLLRASVTVVIVMLVLVGCQYTGILSWMPSDMTNYQPPHVGERGEIKVLTVAMFEVGDPTGDSPGEAQLWIEGEKLDQVIEVPGSHSPFIAMPQRTIVWSSVVRVRQTLRLPSWQLD